MHPFRAAPRPPVMADATSSRYPGISQLPLGKSPAVSILSRPEYTGPIDGDDSDDTAAASQRVRYTMIENDWRGGHVVVPIPPELDRKKNHWKSFNVKGAIGKVGGKR